MSIDTTNNRLVSLEMKWQETLPCRKLQKRHTENARSLRSIKAANHLGG